jgi:hypothetical protein
VVQCLFPPVSELMPSKREVKMNKTYLVATSKAILQSVSTSHMAIFRKAISDNSFQNRSLKR